MCVCVFLLRLPFHPPFLGHPVFYTSTEQKVLRLRQFRIDGKTIRVQKGPAALVVTPIAMRVVKTVSPFRPRLQGTAKYHAI